MLIGLLSPSDFRVVSGRLQNTHAVEEPALIILQIGLPEIIDFIWLLHLRLDFDPSIVFEATKSSQIPRSQRLPATGLRKHTKQA